MLQSVIVYSFLMVTMLLFAVYTAKKESLYVSSPNSLHYKAVSFWRFENVFPLLLFAFVFGMRYDVGTDYLNYLVGYLNKDYVSKGEPLFDFLSEVGWTLNLHYSVYFGVIAFVQVSFFFYAFNKERFLYPFLVFFLFTNGEWLSWMNIIRQTLALCVWVYSIKYIEENKVLNYFFWCIVALLLHNSAAILFIFYPILKSGKDYFKSISFQLFLLVSALMVKEIFSDIIFRLEPLIDSYINIIGNDVYGGYNIVRLENNFIESDGTGIAYVFKIVFNIIVILYSKKMKSYYN